MGFSVAINNSGSIISIGSAASNIVRNYNLTTTWTGATNDVWQTASNWSGNTVPAQFVNALIPAGLTNYPTISAPAECYDLTIESSVSGTGSIIGQSNLTITDW